MAEVQERESLVEKFRGLSEEEYERQIEELFIRADTSLIKHKSHKQAVIKQII